MLPGVGIAFVERVKLASHCGVTLDMQCTLATIDFVD